MTQSLVLGARGWPWIKHPARLSLRCDLAVPPAAWAEAGVT